MSDNQQRGAWIVGGVAALCLALAFGCSSKDSKNDTRTGVLEPQMADTYTKTFRGGEAAAVAVKAEDNAAVELYVYDSAGVLIGHDTARKGQCVVAWSPVRTDTVTIQIVNRTNRKVLYAVAA
jgi:hypothetical protein